MIETCYRQQHPLIKFGTDCKDCNLHSNKSIRGCGPIDLKLIKLIVVSDHPGFYEKQRGYPFVDNQAGKIEDKQQWLNAGALLRLSLSKLFDLDTYTDCWMTNAIKCEPGDKNIMPDNIKICSNHLLDELYVLSTYVPNAPILIAGNKALAAFKLIASDTLNKNADLNSLRRTNNLRYKNHPLVFTFNPAAVSKCQFRIETNSYEYMGDTFISDYKNYPILVGSPYWMFLQDLLMLKKLI